MAADSTVSGSDSVPKGGSVETSDGGRSDVSPLFAAARKGSREALGALFENCRNYLLLVANSSLGEGLQAKIGASDLVQETFAEAQQIFDRFDGKSQEELLRWLTRILQNKLGNTIKRFVGSDKRDVSREERLAAEHPSSATAVPSAPVNSPSGEVITVEEEMRITAAVTELPADYQTVIRLRIVEGRRFEDVGKCMNRSADAARKLFGRALTELQARVTSDDHRRPPN